MKLRLERISGDEKSTMGVLYANGKYACFTLEDAFREAKLAGETRIPAGEYLLELSYSPRFKKDMWEILNVPRFTGIRIHTGNKVEDTEGCLLVGWQPIFKPDAPEELYVSLPAYNYLNKLLMGAKDAGEEISIIIVDVDRIGSL